MKTTNEIEKMAIDYAGKAINSRPKIAWVLQDVRDAYVSAYTQAQQDMIEDVANAPLGAKDFDEWFDGTRGRIIPEQENQMINATQRDFKRWEQEAFTAGRLSGLKEREERVKEIEKEAHLLKLNQHFIQKEIKGE